MQKFLAVVKHEYKKIVMKWSFLIGTLLFPVIGLGFAIVPAIIFSLKGEQTRIVVVDPTGKVLPRLKENLSGERMREKAMRAAKDSLKDMTASQEEQIRRGTEQMSAEFAFVDYDAVGKSPEQVRQELNMKAAGDQIDAYLIVPDDINGGAAFEFRSRKAGDFVTNQAIREALNLAVRSQRLAEANINEALLRDLSLNVDFDAKSISEHGEEKDSEMLYLASLVIGMMIYIMLTIYGQVIMGAVVEEKETRIAEILFSSARPFTLMMGKLVGVGLAGLTQMAIWVGSLAAIVAFLAMQADMSAIMSSLPNITPLMIVYFFVFFIVGYFIYA
jgi:ABC-2 type transport system permease protein